MIYDNRHDEETPYDDITGTIFSTIHKLNIDINGPQTLEMIWHDAPHMEKEWQLIRAVLQTLTLEQIRELTTIQQREHAYSL